MSEKDLNKLESDLLASAEELKQDAVDEDVLKEAAGGYCCNSCIQHSTSCPAAFGYGCNKDCIRTSPS